MPEQTQASALPREQSFEDLRAAVFDQLYSQIVRPFVKQMCAIYLDGAPPSPPPVFRRTDHA